MAETFVIHHSQGAQHDIFPGVRIRTLAGEKMMLSYVEFEPHAVVEMHSHPHEQMGLMLDGEMTFIIDGQEYLVRPGDMWKIPGGVEHKAIAGDAPVRALDVFHPVREDYR